MSFEHLDKCKIKSMKKATDSSCDCSPVEHCHICDSEFFKKFKVNKEMDNKRIKIKQPMYIVGQKVKIKSTPAAYASGQDGILKGVKAGGFVVEIETEIPKPGVVPNKELKKHEVWAEEIEVI